MTGSDERFMRRALMLARRGKSTHPNPKVGAVVVKEGAIISEGFHLRPGTPHAEAGALADAVINGADVRGATVYVTLEPCAHTQNRDGSPRVSCAERCVRAGVGRVVAAMQDPDRRTRGSGFATLQNAGVAVTVGVCESEARELNRPFIKHRETGLPYILHKSAMTLDGKIATVSGSSRWITGEKSREYVHKALRNTMDAVVVGVGTVLADNPSLCVRGQTRNVRQPLRVVIDSGLRTPPTAVVCAPGTVFYAVNTPDAVARAAAITDTGARVAWVEADDSGRVSVDAAMRDLAGRHDSLSVLLEAGGELAASFHRARLVDTVLFFVAPKLVGGANAPTPIDGAGLTQEMVGAYRTGAVRVRRFGTDIALQADVLTDAVH